MSAWDEWCLCTLTRIQAPRSQINVDTFWAWSNAETFPFPLMRWFNPLNTTEKWRGSHDSGAQPGIRDVQIYTDVATGCAATAFTLINEPYYGAIVANLRASLPRSQWGLFSAAAAQLHTWGTGSLWLLKDYGAAPQIGASESMQQLLRTASDGAEYLFDSAGPTLIHLASGDDVKAFFGDNPTMLAVSDSVITEIRNNTVVRQLAGSAGSPSPRQLALTGTLDLKGTEG